MHIIELFVLSTGGNFNIYIWTGSAISSAKQGKSGYIIIGEEIISCLGHANVRAFHENPNGLHTELTFINL